MPIVLALIACNPATPPPTAVTVVPTAPTPECPPEPTGDEPAEVLDCSAFGADLALTDHPERPVDYIVDCAADLGGVLTIGPGTVVAFEENAGIRATGGRLDIAGDDCAPVVLQGTSAVPGHWRGLFIDNDSGGTAPDNRIAFTEVHHAGRGPFNSNGDVGAIIVWADNALSLTDSTIAESGGVGLNLNYGGSALTFARNHFEANGSDGVYARPEYLAALDGETTFADNTGNDVGIQGGAVNAPAVWQALTIPVHVYADGLIDANDGLTIEAGFEATFDTNAGLSITGVGPLQIAGTASAPVILRGTVDAPGHWRGLYIDNDGDPAVVNTIAHAEIRHGGGGSFNSNGDLGGLIVWADNVLELSDTVVADSADVGLNLNYGGTDLTFAANHFADNASHGVYGRPEYVGRLDAATTFAGNGGAPVAVFGGDIGASSTWTALSAPVHVLADSVVRADQGLVLEAGVQLMFEANAGLSIAGALPLVANGTETAPVTLQGTTTDRGHWRGVLLDSSDDTATHVLEHTAIHHAGGGPFNSNGDLGALIVWSDQDVTLRDVTITESGDVGLNATYSGSTLVLEGANTFTSNALPPAFVEPTLMSAFQSTDTYSGNDADHILVTQGFVDGTHTWQALDVPYLVRSTNDIFYTLDLADTSDVTISPGVEIAFDTDTGLASTGTFNALGTAIEPIVMRGVLPVAGHWRGLYFEDPDNTSAVFTVDHAQIADAGGMAFNSNGDLAGIIAWADTSLTATNVAFTNLAAACAVNTRYQEVSDVYTLTGSTSDASAQLSCDPTALP